MRGAVRLPVTKVPDAAEDDGIEEERFLICGVTVVRHDCLLRPPFNWVFCRCN